ncbi:aTP-dependent transcriptional regulator, MalT-like, LuxR family [Rhodococcus sp. MTM3W5.2]|nr:aTP-dependent transcriptional regulator, MalT-like, LuxR family [Rhodococcus sp. MTM3W5.2]
MARVIRDHCGPARNRPLPPGTTALVATSAQRAFLQVGEPVWAAQVAEQTAAELGHGGEVAVLHATMSLHHRRLDAARRELAPVLSGELVCLSEVTLIRAWLMAATIADTRNESITARSALVEAMTIAEPEGVLRPFYDGGEPLRDLLDRHRGRFGVYDKFAERARSVIPQSAQGTTDLLTPARWNSSSSCPPGTPPNRSPRTCSSPSTPSRRTCAASTGNWTCGPGGMPSPRPGRAGCCDRGRAFHHSRVRRAPHLGGDWESKVH